MDYFSGATVSNTPIDSLKIKVTLINSIMVQARQLNRALVAKACASFCSQDPERHRRKKRLN
ncbi:Hypothetical protein FKW44_014925 [Caligus rogercresseyi]|uniref:Uncharacterized protein n=1 Tax=Caligus rogercresseyi TaxID=217165 RepID=A0A7T8H079_CALRO|nr:Hypothetical protein FKW44_014925 [Caligus rogercresseyi]